MNTDTYIEQLPETKQRKPIVQMIFSLLLGALSIFLGGVVGIIVGIVAERLALSVKANYPKSIYTKLSALGGALGIIGMVLSVINIILLAVVIIIVVWIFAGGSLLGVTLF